MARRRLEVEIVGDATKLEKSFKKAERSINSFGRSAGKSASKSMGRGPLGGALGIGIGGVGKAGVFGAGIAIGSALAVKGLSSVVKAAKEAEVAQANLGQAFASSGVSTAKYGEQVDKAIQSTSKLAGFDDELVSKSYANLLRTTKSVAKSTRDVALAANIARARHISLAAATKVVEKAENGQLRGLKAVGIQIDKNTTSAEAISRAQKQFAGSAVTYGNTAAGAQEKLGVAFENLRERIGLRLLPTITKLTLKLVDFLDWSEKNWPKFAKGVQDAYTRTKPVIDAIVGEVKGIANAIAGMVLIVHGIFTGDWAEAWRGLKQYAVAGIGGVVKALATLPIKITAALGKRAFAGLEHGLVAAITGAINRAISILNAAISAYNKIPIAPNIPTIGKIGSGTPASKPAGTSIVPGERARQSVGATTVNLVVDGRVLAQTIVPHLQKASKKNVSQSRGRYAGHPPPMSTR